MNNYTKNWYQIQYDQKRKEAELKFEQYALWVSLAIVSLFALIAITI